METARPSSPSDQGRQDYRRGGYDKQGEVGAGSSKPEFVSSNSSDKRRADFCLVSVVAMGVDVSSMTATVLVPINNKEDEIDGDKSSSLH